MTGELTSAEVDATARRICEMLVTSRDEFNRLDAQSGDGDMGSSLAAAAGAVLDDATPLSEDLGAGFGRLASSIAKRSGSSLSALAMTGLMSLAKSTQGRTTLTGEEFVLALRQALAVMQSRSGAQFGDKTVLDALKAMIDASGQESVGQKPERAVSRCIEEFRGRPAAVGRARLAPDRGIGLDDPGMVVLLKVAALL